MISRWLRTLLALELVALAAVAIFLMNGASPAMIVGLVIGVFPVLNFAVTVAIYVILRLYAPPSAVGSDFNSAYRWWSAVGECLALLAQFMVIAPFERWWMGAVPRAAASCPAAPGIAGSRLSVQSRTVVVVAAGPAQKPPRGRDSQPRTALREYRSFRRAIAATHRVAGGGNRSSPDCACNS